MKTTKMLSILFLALAVVFRQAGVSKAEPMGTAWTYQGRLLDANGPPDGLYDFRFKLFDDSNTVTGNQLGSAVDINGLDVINGYFTVELDFGSNVFDGDARWLEIDVRQTDSNDSNDFITLNPRQEVTPTPYALQTRGIFVDDNGNVSIGGTDPWYALDVYRAVSDSWIAGFHNLGTGDMDGGVIVRAFGGDPLLVQSATANVLNVKQNGKVGIGTINPDELLTLEKLGQGNSAPQMKVKGYYPGSGGGSYLVLGKSRGSSLGENVTTQDNDPLGLIDTLGINTSNNESTATRLMFRQDGDAAGTYIPGRIEFYTSDGSSGASERMRIDKSGKVGIGTSNPDAKLEVNGEIRISSDSQSKLTVGRYSSSYPIAYIRAKDAYQIRLQTDDSTKMVIDDSGKVGIGTDSPGANMDVRSTSTNNDVIEAYASDGSELFNVREMGSGDGVVYIKDKTGAEKIRLSSYGYSSFNGGNVGIGDVGVPLKKLVVRGNILVKSESTGADVLELGQGLDYAEGFNVTENVGIEPGTVLVIDSENPGKLKVSHSAYDGKVAGIVAGANGVGSGVRLGIGQFDYDVALAGRVYCKVDATEEAVQAGDQLTTSGTAGHAMKAADYDRARGAVLGKAMESLAKGKKGKILVLVTLQ